MIQMTMDLLDALKDAGFSSYRLRKDKLLGEATITKLRNGGLPSWHELNTICSLLHRQPGDFLQYIPDSSSVPVSTADDPSITE